jgi:hypothetical protein
LDRDGRACVSNGNGGWKDDDRGGQTCKEVGFADSKGVKASAVVTADLPESTLNPFARQVLPMAGAIASPAANFTTEGLRLFGYIAAPPLMAAADYASGVNRSNSNVFFAVIPILIPEARLAHVLESHTLGGALSAGKSLFNAGEDVKGLIQAAEAATGKSVGNVLIRTIDAGRIIGMDRNTQQATSVYTVITKNAGELITAYPGRP